MPTSKIIIENQSSTTMHFHIELGCIPFEISPGKSAEIVGTYTSEPITIQFSDYESGLFGAVFPSDGDVVVRVDGQELRG